MKKSNSQVLFKILNYCNDISNSANRFGNDFDTFSTDKDYQNSICMSLMQIGELTTHLTEEFKTEFNREVDWRGCKAFRNIVAHRYNTIRKDEVWNIIQNEIPSIKEFCERTIRQFEILNADMVEFEYDDDFNIIDDYYDYEDEQSQGR